MLKKGDASVVKIMNRELIINELKLNPNQSRADLSKKTHLSKPTISEIVKELIDEGLIIEMGVGTSSGGKKPILLTYNSRSNYVIGILIDNETIFLGLGDMNGELINLVKRRFPIHTDGQVIVDLIVEGIHTLLELEKVSFELVLGVVVGVSGFKMDNTEIINSSPTIYWKNIDLREELSNQLKKEVIVENDVNLMTIGEFHKGQGDGIDHFVYLYIGNGIGSGLFLNGQFYNGFHSAAGEIGYMMIGKEELYQQNLGVFEANYGRYGLNVKLNDQNIKNDEEDSLLKILQDHRDNPKIKELLDETIYNWAKATVNIISVIDPQTVIFSGEFSHIDTESLNQFIKIVENYVPKTPEFKITKLGFKAGLYGSFHLALDYFHKAGFKQNQTH